MNGVYNYLIMCKVYMTEEEIIWLKCALLVIEEYFSINT